MSTNDTLRKALASPRSSTPACATPGGRLKSRLWVAMIALSGCGGSMVQVQVASGEITDPAVLAAAQIEVVSGDDQEGEVGVKLPAPVVVLVTDASGRPLEGAPVLWRLSQGRGAARGGPAAGNTVRLLTGSDGRVALDWELGTVAGQQLASAEIATATTAPSLVAGPSTAPPEGKGNQKAGFKAKGKPAKPAEIRLSHANVVVAVGESATVTATVVDGYGNAIPDAVIEWVTSDAAVARVVPNAPAPAPSYSVMGPSPLDRSLRRSIGRGVTE